MRQDTGAGNMLNNNKFPILEFDTNRAAKISADSFLKKTLPEKCIITFFRDVLDSIVKEENLKVLDYLHSEIMDIPIYEYKTERETICLTMSFLTAPGAACTIEELHAKGCNKFIICGGAGSLEAGTAVGKLILPNAAIRDEGTSYHYLPPSREVRCNPEVLSIIKNGLAEMKIPYAEGKTWTTDAIYRETEDKIKRRLEEGCITVEMEAAAFFSVAEFYGLSLVQLLYAGDDLSAEEWDSRDWNKQRNIRENMLLITLKLIEKL